MRTTTQSFGAFCIIILSIISFCFTARAVRADDSASTTPPSATDPDDPSAVWYCDSEFDADGNPVESCGWGHWQESCDSDAGDQNCSQNFQMDSPSGSELFAPVLQDLLSGESLSLKAEVAKGVVSWNYAPVDGMRPSLIGIPNSSGPSLSDVVNTANLTLDLYQGVIGSSTLMYSQPLASTTSGSFPFTFDSNSQYFLALSATYPDGTYPPGETPADRCPVSSQGDFCIIPSYPLTDFQNVVENGFALEASGTGLGSYTPAAFGFLQLVIPTDPPTPAVSNVLFIPGTLTSRLYMKNPDGSERELWEPRSDLDVGPLAMKPDGTSVNTVYTRDLVDQLYSNDSLYSPLVQKALGGGANVYGPFESFMNELVASGTIKEWRAFPYDWRYDVSDIVKNGTLIESASATATPRRVYLQDVVAELASTSPTGKVTIIAHSNGGLIAKALAMDLQSKGELGLLDHIIMVGTPQFGTPKSLLDLLHGSEFTELGGLLMYSGSVRTAENTMAGPYDLLPSSAYFANVSDPVATFDNQSPASLYQKAFGASIDSFTKLAEFVEDTFHIDNSAGLPGSTRTPIAGSKALVQKALATHSAIDAWTPPSGLALTTIAGWGQLTPYQIAYSGSSGLNCDRTNFFVPVACSLQPQLQNSVLETMNGDNTVVAASAIGVSTDALYFDTKSYELFSGEEVVHQNLLNSQPVQQEIVDQLERNPKKEPFVSETIPYNGSNNKTVVSAHSPVNISATDATGRTTGIVTIPGLSGMQFEKEDIPGSSIQVVGDEKYLYLPESGSYTISMQGYDSGATTLNVGTMDTNGGVIENETYADIPTTASTTATFNVKNGGQGPSTIDVDVSGSGSTTAVDAATTTQTDQNYRASLFTLRALFGWRGLPALLRALLVKAFRDFEGQKNPNAAAYSALQTLLGVQSGVKLTFPQGLLMTHLLKELGF